MARLGLDENQKFKRLALALNGLAGGMGRQLARGLLETLWGAAYERADDYLGDSDDVEIAADWKGERGALTKLLEYTPTGKTAGFIEHDLERGGYRIHGFDEHAPSWVAQKAQKAAERAARGQTISDLRRAAGAKGRAAQLAKQAVGQTEGCLQERTGQNEKFCLAKSHNGTGRDGTGDPPVAPQGGQPAILTYPELPAGKSKRRDIPQHIRPGAERVLAALCLSRRRVISGARDLRPTDENLRHIAARLQRGATEAECLHVIAVREEEVRNGGAPQWFDAVTPFRPDWFAKSLAQPAPTLERARPQLTPEQQRELEEKAMADGMAQLRRMGIADAEP